MRMKFKDLSISARTIAALEEMGYSDATEVQEKTIPLILQGEDLMVRSQTGTGKTAAFGVGLIDVISRDRGRKALILAPTRELAAQITSELRSIAKHHRLEIFAVYGGTGMGRQTVLLRRGFDILVATPGRLLDHLQQGNARLESVNCVVLDEADRMLDMGFKPDIDRILGRIGRDRQVLLFSATFDPPIVAIANSYLSSPQSIEVGPVGKVEKIDEEFIRLSRAQKLDKLKEILKREPMSRTLVFVGSKRAVEGVCKKLNADGIDAQFIHGGRSQNQRERAVRGFQEGSFRILVATDVAARGLHIDDISHVINYDQADSTDMHTHRIGRTGRMGKGGKAITFVETDPLPKVQRGRFNRGGFGHQQGGYGRPSHEGHAQHGRDHESSGQHGAHSSSGYRNRPRDRRHREQRR
ncbi:MAG: DEAD/DEAH box helicase [Candidatus ainarchaeum sp.]|nr:DEAD/DEAH box helicase [Candidatus ainarchaeum sp.]